jgi:hypothetical protein
MGEKGTMGASNGGLIFASEKLSTESQGDLGSRLFEGRERFEVDGAALFEQPAKTIWKASYQGEVRLIIQSATTRGSKRNASM